MQSDNPEYTYYKDTTSSIYQTEFWDCITFAHQGKLHPSQIQFDAMRFHLGIRLGDADTEDIVQQRIYRFLKRAFLKRIYLANSNNPPTIITDQTLDEWLDDCGKNVVPGYESYNEVIKMKWNNPHYLFPEDVELQKLISTTSTN